ncbi:hypothetical protein C7M84_008619 [Penaeus vannamei]|uniref:Uncharacterized protein n=1 Tax=Penaeus vannamei TaxID=6689 RepID=A0A423T973_PENVA|nr:hypothetical protein C7M84_008619 [Penaeus vannamei]
MGGVRVVVAVVLSVISLTVLSLHVALCLHYPSPLFAVTLLLNPSLWLFLGLVGMGCALLLSYRDRQRKVRSGLCTTCHTRYGATVDSKWRSQDAKWPDGLHHQRGPSRAIYSYNGNSHKFYASYGTINEKQSMEMTRSSPLVQRDVGPRAPRPLTRHHSAPSGGKAAGGGDSGGGGRRKDEPASEPIEVGGERAEARGANNAASPNGDDTSLDKTQLKDDTEETCSQQKWTDDEDDEDSDDSEDNGCHSDTEGMSSKNLSSEEKQPSVLPLEEDPSKKHINATRFANAPARSTAPCGLYIPHRDLIQERKYCDCMGAYGGARYARHGHLPLAEWERRARGGRRYPRDNRVVGKYNKKLLMQCKLKDPDDVPLELFAAKTSSSDDNSGMSIVSSDRDLISESGSLPLDDVFEHVEQAESSLSSDVVGKGSEASIKNKLVKKLSFCQDSQSDGRSQADEMSVSSDTELLRFGKAKEKLSRHAPMAELLPVRHTPPSPTQATSSTELGTGAAEADTAPLELFDCQPQERDYSDDQSGHGYDQDGASVSSDSGLLPATERTSSVGRDFLRSPLWRPFRGGKKDRKSSLVGSETEDLEEGQRSPASTEASQGSNSEGKSPAKAPGRSQPRQGHRLRSLFTSKKPHSKAKSLRSSAAAASDRRNPVRSPPAAGSSAGVQETPLSPLSSSLRPQSGSFSPRANPGGAQPAGPVSKLKSSATGARRLAKSAASRPSVSPAKSVRSLVLRNIHRTTSRSHEQPDHSQDVVDIDEDSIEAPAANAVTSFGSPASSSSAFTSPSVRPKERKKPRARLKGKFRHEGADSKMLLSDDATD